MTTLTGKRQVNGWVLLSRRSQLRMHQQAVEKDMPALKQPGIFKWIETNLPPEYLAGVKRTARDYRMALNDYIGDVDPYIPEDEEVNFRLYLGITGYDKAYADKGVFATMLDVQEFYVENGNGRKFVINRTWDEPTH